MTLPVDDVDETDTVPAGYWDRQLAVLAACPPTGPDCEVDIDPII